jgi:hypothetical protein
MPWGRISLLAGLLLVSSTPAGTAQVYNSADFVRSLYQRYLNREPSSNELTQWVWAFQKGTTMNDAQVTFLSSEDYFVRQARDPKPFVTGLFAEVLNRAPSQAEVSAWVNTLNVYRGNREKLVREFLKAAQQETAQRVPLPPSPAPSDGAQVRDGQLSATARLLRDSLEDELGGTQQGRQLSLISRNLVNASRSLEQILTGSRGDFAQAYNNVHQTLSAMEDEFQGVHFSAPNSSAYLSRYTRIFESLEGAPPQIAPSPPLNPATPGSVPGMDAGLYNEILRLNTALSGDTQQLLFVLRSMFATDDYHKQLLGDVEFFYSHVDAFEHSLRVGMPVAEARTHVLRLRSLAEGVSQGMRANIPAGGVVQRWMVVNGDLQQVGAMVGVSMESVIDPGQPVLYNAPTYNQLPYHVQRPMPTRTPRNMVPAIDQAVAQVNAFTVGFNPFLSFYPQVPALQTRARTLRLSLIQLRQDVTGNAGPRQQQARLSEINQRLEELNASWRQIVDASRLTNAPDPRGIVLSVQRVNEAFLAGYALN